MTRRQLYLVASLCLVAAPSLARSPYIQPEDMPDLVRSDPAAHCLVAAAIVTGMTTNLTSVILETPDGRYTNNGVSNKLTPSGFAFVMVPKGPFRVAALYLDHFTGEHQDFTYKPTTQVLQFGKGMPPKNYDVFRKGPAHHLGDVPVEMSGTCNGGFVFLGVWKLDDDKLVKADEERLHADAIANLRDSVKGAASWAAAIDHPAANTPVAADVKIGPDLDKREMPPKPKVGVTVMLLTDGAEPRRELAYAPKAGARRKVVVSLVTMGKPGKSPPEPLPHLLFTLDTTAVDGAAPAPLKTTWVVTHAEPEPSSDQMAAMITKNMTNGQDGVAGWIVADEHGLHLDGEHKFPPGKEPKVGPPASVVGQVTNSVVPLPEGAVGVGATWRAELTASRPTFTYTQWTVYKVLAIEGNVVKLGVESTMRTLFAKPIAMPLNGGTQRAQMVGTLGQGKGEARIDLGQMLPLHYQVKSMSESLFAPPGGSGDPVKNASVPPNPMELTVDSK